jgi:hypothetical protein
MVRRRAILGFSAFGLIVADCFWIYSRFVAPNANITYVGTDSVAVVVGTQARAAQLQNGKWDFDPIQSFPVDIGFGPREKDISLVSLAPKQTLGQAVEVIRDLKSRHLCNVLILESANIGMEAGDALDQSGRVLEIPALVLCGYPIGDAGFLGKLPTDRPIHVRSIR